jgi:transcriptional regulator with XRE-family HTH domain
MAKSRTRPSTSKNELGRFIRARREELGLSQLQLARALGYKWSNFIGMIETGSAMFPFDRWDDFAKELQLPKHEFLRLVLAELFPRVLPYVEFVEAPEENEEEERSPAEARIMELEERMKRLERALAGKESG